MNRVSLIGRITKDPEVRYSQNGTAFLNFTLAVSRNQKDANGQTISDFISIAVIGQPADYLGKYAKKGFLIAVAGRIQTRNYPGQDGRTVYVTEVLAEQVEILTPRDPNQQSQNYQANQPRNDYGQQGGYQQNNFQGGYNNPSYGNNQQSNGYQSQQPESFDVNDAADSDLPF